METIVMKLSDIRPAKYNPRIELKQGDEEYEALKNSLNRFSEVLPLVVNRTTGNLVSGHQRLKVLKETGVEETEVVFIDVDADKEKLLNIALNKIDGDWDYKKLNKLFSEFSTEDIKFTGYTAEEIEGLFGSETPNRTFTEEDDLDDSDEEAEDEIEKTTEKPDKEFSIFFSFPTKEVAEKWLKEKGQDCKFEGTSHNITIRMEGADFDKGN